MQLVREPQPIAPSPPTFAVPPGACDCHFHLYDRSPAYRFRPEGAFDPPDVPLTAWHAMRSAIGIERGVFVHTGGEIYEDDALLIDTLKADASVRGVAMVSPEVAETGAGLRKLQEIGAVCGLRVSLSKLAGVGGGEQKLRQLQGAARWAAELGMHLQLHIPGKLLPDVAPLIQQLPVERVVIDHMGRLTSEMPASGPEFSALAGLIETGRVWIKLSGAYREQRQGPPYSDMIPLGKALVAVAKERAVWGSDWPFDNFAGAQPDAGELLNCLGDWAPDEATRTRILVDNAAELYGF